MKAIPFLFLIILLAGCHSADKDQTQSDEPSYDFLFNQVEKQQEEKKQNYISTMKKKSIVFEAYGDCVDALDDTMHEEKFPYINSSKMSDSALFVDFKFIDACCQEFFGNYKVKNDTLVFKFEAVGSTACDCYCWYQYTLQINHIPKPFSAFEVVYW